MAATTTTVANAPQPEATDFTLLNELWEEIDRHPPALDARKILLMQLSFYGWNEAACDVARDILKISPKDEEAKTFLASNPEAAAKSAATAANAKTKGPAVAGAASTTATTASKSKSLRSYTKGLFDGVRPSKRSKADEPVDVVGAIERPADSKEIARTIAADPDGAVDALIADFEKAIKTLRGGPGAQEMAGGANKLDDDAIREILAKRGQAVGAHLPAELQDRPGLALMHVEHEALGRKYVVEETMLGEPVAEIARADFWVSEDAYPWDMGELAQAIAANGGVMRNPLSRQLFTPSDVRSIVAHPRGRSLGALQVRQAELRAGVRPLTVQRLQDLAAVLLADLDDDQLRSRRAVDEFLAYVATLPADEQKAVDELRVAATDTHTGLAYDFTIGSSVRDAQANRVCMHKTGDYITKAVEYLRRL